MAGTPSSCGPGSLGSSRRYVDIDVEGAERLHGAVHYLLACRTIQDQSAAEWQARVPLTTLQAKVDAPVRSALGEQRYAQVFRPVPSVAKWTCGHTKQHRVEAWFKDFSSAVERGQLPDALVDEVLHVLGEPERIGAAARAPRREGGSRCQHVFLVRHAQSRWNAAADRAQVLQMYREFDHGLTAKGRAQAEKLRHDIATARQRENEKEAQHRVSGRTADDAPHTAAETWCDLFWNAGLILTSPLTRAVQTAAIALRDVLAAGPGELVLVKALREKKGLGGADVVGTATGGDIRTHVRSQLNELYSSARTSPLASSFHASLGAKGLGDERTKAKSSCSSEERADRRRSFFTSFDRIGMNTQDVEEKWWDSVVELPTHFHSRLGKFLTLLRESGEGSIVVVGHSLFFCALFGEVLAHGGVSTACKELCRALAHRKVPNCGVVGLRLAWTDGQEAPYVQDIVPLFGTELPERGVLLETDSPPLPAQKGSFMHVIRAVSGRTRLFGRPSGHRSQPSASQ